jgi:hypothetical protein
LHSGGTGNFAITTRISTFIIDCNFNFAVIGLAVKTNQLLSATVSIDSGASIYAGEVTNYVFSLVPSEDLPANIDFKLTFPVLYDLSYLKKG